MTLLTNPIMTPGAVLRLSSVLKVRCRAARAIIDVLAALLSAPPWRGDIAGLYPSNSRAQLIAQSRMERLYSYETSRFL